MHCSHCTGTIAFDGCQLSGIKLIFTVSGTRQISILVQFDFSDLTWTANSLYCGRFHISKMYFSHWEPPGVSERMWSGHLEASISGMYQTLGGHSGRPWE